MQISCKSLITKNGRWPQQKWKNGRQPQQKNENGRQSNFFWKTRMTTSKKMEDDLK